MSESTALILGGRGGGMMTAADANAAVEFALKMGKVFQFAGVGGCKTEQDGQVLALACMMRGCDPFEMTARNHIMGGKLAKKADVMLADFNSRGGSHTWLKDGNDGIEAALELKTREGKSLVSTFTIKDATDAGYVKAGTRWTKGPKAIGSMLRARCTSEGIRMLDPSVSAGVYTPEELDEVETTTEPEAGRKPRRTKEEIEARKAELTGAATTAAPTAAPREPGADEIVDAEFTATPSTATEAAPFDVPPRPPEPEPVKPLTPPVAPAATTTAATTTATPTAKPAAAGSTEHTAVLMEIAELIRQMGATMDQLNQSMRAKAGKYPSLAALTPEQLAVSTIENLSLADAKVTLATLQTSFAAMKAAKK